MFVDHICRNDFDINKIIMRTAQFLIKLITGLTKEIYDLTEPKAWINK